MWSFLLKNKSDASKIIKSFNTSIVIYVWKWQILKKKGMILAKWDSDVEIGIMAKFVFMVTWMN